mgnify:CR=1 FL=1
MYAGQILLSKHLNVFSIPGFRLDVVGECSVYILRRESISRSERTEKMRSGKKTVPVVKCQVNEKILCRVELVGDYEVYFVVVR